MCRPDKSTSSDSTGAEQQWGEQSATRVTQNAPECVNILTRGIGMLGDHIVTLPEKPSRVQQGGSMRAQSSTVAVTQTDDGIARVLPHYTAFTLFTPIRVRQVAVASRKHTSLVRVSMTTLPVDVSWYFK
jgi:hypothetical protein